MDQLAIDALLADRFGEAVLSAIKKAYQIRSDGHRPGDGDNAMTFGMNVRFSIEKFVEASLAQSREVGISRPAGSFQIAYRNHLYHFYKFGMDAGDSVDDLNFDDSETKINIVADNQLPLPGIPDLRHLIVAHSGNPEDGLLEVYIGAPNALGTQGSPWAWRHCVFAAEGVAPRTAREDNTGESRPSFLDQPQPTVVVRPRKKIDAASDRGERL